MRRSFRWNNPVTLPVEAGDLFGEFVANEICILIQL